MKKIALLLYTVIVLVLAASCDRRAEYLTASGAMLGTTDITDCTAQELYRAIMQIDAEAKASMSIFDSTSLLSRINRERPTRSTNISSTTSVWPNGSAA